MRKALSLVLAVVMVLGMATVAFAATQRPVLTLDTKNMTTDPTKTDKGIGATASAEYGKTIYIPIQYGATIEASSSNSGNQIRHEEGDYLMVDTADSEFVKDVANGIRVKVSYDMGKEFVSGTPDVVTKKATDLDLSDYVYYLAIETVEAPEETDSNDVIMYVDLNTNSEDIPVTISLDNGSGDIDTYFSFEIPTEETRIVTFDDVDYTDPIDISFDDGFAMFTVNAKGEADKSLYFDYEVNQAVLDANPTANIDFLRFKENPSFYKSGIMAITCDADAFVYEITEDNEVVALQGEYNKETEMFEFRTRTLGYYAISDVELVDGAAPVVDGDDVIDEVPSASEAPTTDDGTKDNPDTGVNGFANVAVVTAVVALAAAGAVAFKK